MLQTFMHDRDLPAHLRSRLSRYLEFSYRKSKENYGAAIDLPHALALKVAAVQFNHVIDKCTVPGAPLRGCSDMFINTLMFNLQMVCVPPSSTHHYFSVISRFNGSSVSSAKNVAADKTVAVTIVCSYLHSLIKSNFD
jgi:hypothetical protein